MFNLRELADIWLSGHYFVSKVGIRSNYIVALLITSSFDSIKYFPDFFPRQLIFCRISIILLLPGVYSINFSLVKFPFFLYFFKWHLRSFFLIIFTELSFVSMCISKNTEFNVCRCVMCNFFLSLWLHWRENKQASWQYFVWM